MLNRRTRSTGALSTHCMDITLNIEPQTRWEREELEGMRLGHEEILVGCVAGDLSFPMVGRWLWAAVKLGYDKHPDSNWPDKMEAEDFNPL